MGTFVITLPAVSFARELWRYGEDDLAYRAAAMTPAECAAVGERAGAMVQTDEPARLWPDGPRGTTSAVLLAAVEHLEGRARPCARTRRRPETSMPVQWQVSEEERWALLRPVAREMELRLRGR